MRAHVVEIAWHNREPIFSLDFSRENRLVTAGADRTVSIWYIDRIKNHATPVEVQRSHGIENDGFYVKNPIPKCICTLSGHFSTINVAKFSTTGTQLATGADSGDIILWRCTQQVSLSNDTASPTNTQQNKSLLDQSHGLPVSYMGDNPNLPQGDPDAPDSEKWAHKKTLRGHLQDIQDLDWSPDDSKIVSASVDNVLMVWDATKGTLLSQIRNHTNFVQGVSWDPLGKYFASLSNDRSLKIFYSDPHFSVVSSVDRVNIEKICSDGSAPALEDKTDEKQFSLFHDDFSLLLFRRLAWSPDGSFLVCPGGRHPSSAQAAHIFLRNDLHNPAGHLCGFSKPVVAVRFCPRLFEKTGKATNALFDHLGYRMIWAVASVDTVYIYDTEHPKAIGLIESLHYEVISDLCWSDDASYLIVSSLDGYCSMICFENDELGASLAETAIPAHLLSLETLTNLERNTKFTLRNPEDPTNDTTLQTETITLIVPRKKKAKISVAETEKIEEEKEKETIKYVEDFNKKLEHSKQEEQIVNIENDVVSNTSRTILPSDVKEITDTGGPLGVDMSNRAHSKETRVIRIQERKGNAIDSVVYRINPIKAGGIASDASAIEKVASSPEVARTQKCIVEDDDITDEICIRDNQEEKLFENSEKCREPSRDEEVRCRNAAVHQDIKANKECSEELTSSERESRHTKRQLLGAEKVKAEVLSGTIVEPRKKQGTLLNFWGTIGSKGDKTRR